MFCLTDRRLPFAQVAMNATGSTAASTILVMIILVIFCNAVRGSAMSASRTLLAFGRDGMLPYSEAFTYCFLGEPLWGTILTVTVSLLAGMVQFGPAAAFNSLLGSSTIMLFLSYGMSGVL